MKRKGAYFTVEAALVFPFVLGALIFIIFMFFFQYDRCLLEQDMGLLLLYGKSVNTDSEEEITRALSQRSEEIFGEDYVAWSQEKLQIIWKKSEMKVEGRGSMAFPFPGWNFFNKRNIWSAECTRKALWINPVDYIRILRNIGGSKDADGICEEPEQ